MNNNTKRNAVIAAVICVIALFIFSGCDSGREYYEDIRIPLETRQAEIIIREWSFLLGSGEEVYYKDGKKTILLGRLSGADDGFCPFKEGLYSVAVNESKLTIKWCANPGDDTIHWEKAVFELPSN